MDSIIMNKKAKRGGSRLGAGRPESDDKKKQVNLFIKESLIDKLGGKKAIQTICYEHLHNL